MACGEFAKPIFDVIDALGGDDNHHAVQTVLISLIKYLSSETIEDFSDNFARHAGILGYEDHELCMKCQETYAVSKDHSCSPEKETENSDFNS